MLRGGSWNNNARNCRSAYRNNNNPDNRNNNNGFRLVLPQLTGRGGCRPADPGEIPSPKNTGQKPYAMPGLVDAWMSGRRLWYGNTSFRGLWPWMIPFQAVSLRAYKARCLGRLCSMIASKYPQIQPQLKVHDTIGVLKSIKFKDNYPIRKSREPI